MTADCELFVDAADDGAVLALLRSHFGVEDSLGYLAVPGFELRIGRNQLARTTAPDPDDFLDWPTTVEVYGAAGSDLPRFVADLAALLRSAGHRMVADCLPGPAG